MDDLVMSPEETDEFLSGPHTGQLATNGPTIRPLWYQWDGKAFWIISGPWAKLYERVQRDPRVAFCIDIGDFDNGLVKQVIAHGSVEIHDYDAERARRLLHRYLGPDEDSWSDSPDDYRGYLRDDGPPGAAFLRLEPKKLTALNFSYARTRTKA
ncbi:pyridoxamine 5'-phosphate oxidase family protein [Mycobacterium lentiflavum]|nr:pyridoxamine 5'-phosphate oxidase family protein [Mycobacterium lentiflavum]